MFFQIDAAWELHSFRLCLRPLKSERGGVTQAVKKFLADAASRDVTFYEVEGGEHELLMGTKWQDLTDRIAAWLKGHSVAS